MKSAMKKLLSLMLVAMLLVSAIPFAASADTSSSEPASGTYVVQFFDVNQKVIKSLNVTSGATVGDISSIESSVGTKSGYTFKGWQKYSGGDVYTSAQVAEMAVTGATNFFPYFESSGTTTISADSTKKTDKVSKDSYYVYLKIYTNNDISSATKTIDITEGYAVDNYVSWSEVEQYVKNNFSASNSLGITIDGIYVYEGSWASNWLNSEYKETDVAIPDDEYRTGNIYLMVMLTGKSGGTVSTSSSSSSSSTSSNPKTGDTIGTSFLALGVSASALAAAYFVEKKRLAR